MKVFKLEKVIAHMKNGVNVKQNKNGVGDRLSRIETISDGNFNFDKVGYAELSSDQKSKYKINKNDILFSHINSLEHLGKTAIYEANQEMYHGVNLLLIRANDLVLPKYLRYFFVFLRNSGYWISNGKQAINQASVNQTDIKNLQIPVPSLQEQEKIVEKLDIIFGKIDYDISNYKNRLIEIGNLFNSTFHSTFANTGDKYKEFFLEDCIKHQRGLTFKKSDVVDHSDLKVLRANNIDYEKYSFINNDFLYLNPKIQIEDKYFTEKNDIIVCMSTGSRKHLGKVAIIEENTRYVVGGFLGKITANLEVLDPKYLYYFLINPKIKKIIHDSVISMTINNLRKDILNKLLIPAPNIKEQKKIVENLDKFFDNMTNLTQNYEKIIANFNDLKKSILYKEFTYE